LKFENVNETIEAHIQNFRRLEERIRTARRHLEFGRTMIEYYKGLLEKFRAESRDTTPVEHVLEAFERSQRVFEGDLAELERRQNSGAVIPPLSSPR
jgi:hypothetical protein